MDTFTIHGPGRNSQTCRTTEVREDHTNPKPSDVKNTICSVSLDGSGTMEVLVEGAVDGEDSKLNSNQFDQLGAN